MDKMTHGYFWDSLVRLHGRVPLRVKIMGIVVAFVGLLGLSVILEINTTMTGILRDQLVKRATAIGNDVASRSVNLLLIGDTFNLYEIAKSVPTNYEDVRYLLILDNDSHVVAHNFGKGIPAGLLELRQLNTPGVIEFETDEGDILDIAVPIAGGKAGWVRVGMTEANVQKTTHSLLGKIILTTMGVSILGLIGAFGLAALLVKPIQRLVEVSRAVAQGDLSQRVKTESQDEIGQLGDSFNAMSIALDRTTQEREELLEELKEKELLRVELLKKVITAQEEERKRISRELHDETSHSLTSLMVGLKVLSEVGNLEESRRMARELREMAHGTLREVHRLAVELRPTVLDDMGLQPALERYISEYRRKHGIDVDLHVVKGHEGRVAGEIETALYRIIQEALTNTAKYANAKNVSILLECNPHEVKLIVEDDGQGFDVEHVLSRGEREQHLGLAGMKERANLLGGWFEIESNNGLGTTIYVRLPMERGWDHGQ